MEAYKLKTENTRSRATAFLSIIIPVLNDEVALSSLLPFLIENSIGQEIIIVDAIVSSDNSAEIASEFDVKYIKSDQCGRACQMNEGARHASGDVLMFLHADVRPPANYVAEISKVIDNGNSAGFFAYNFSPSNRWLDINAKFTANDGLFAGGGDQCQFMTRDTYEKMGGYDESYVIMEDFALIRKMKKQNIPLAIIQERATVSSRKYSKNSYLLVNLVNFIVFVAFLLGVSPSTLKKMYRFSLK